VEIDTPSEYSRVEYLLGVPIFLGFWIFYCFCVFWFLYRIYNLYLVRDYMIPTLISPIFYLHERIVNDDMDSKRYRFRYAVCVSGLPGKGEEKKRVTCSKLVMNVDIVFFISSFV
jgi:hypothetical protein